MTNNAVRTALARAVAVTAVLPLAAGVLVAAAPGASADVVAPGDGTVFTSHSTFEIRASYERANTDHRLTLTSPGGPAVTVAEAPAGLNGGTMTYSLDTGCWTYPSSSCSGRRPAPNGTWTVTQSGGSSGSSTFVTRIRPAAPTAVEATALNPREARVSWRAGDEPDLTGWVVFEGSEVVADGIGRGSCSGSTCSTVISYATEGSGEHTFGVKAYRSVAPGSSSTLESALSSPASARLENPPPPPPPSPEPTDEGSGATGDGEPAAGGGTGSGGTTTGSGGTTTGSGSTGTGGTTTGSGGTTSGSGGSATTGSAGGTGGTAGPAGGSTFTADQRAIAQRKAFALGFTAFGPKLGIPKLPPLPQSQSPAIAPELADGTYEPTLGFEDQVLTERVPTAQGPTARVRNVVGTALDSERLIRSTAVALVLLLAAAHLRRWLGSHVEEH